MYRTSMEELVSTGVKSVSLVIKITPEEPVWSNYKILVSLMLAVS